MDQNKSAIRYKKKIIKLYIDGDKIDQYSDEYSDEYRFGVHSDQIILLMDILKTIVIIHGY